MSTISELRLFSAILQFIPPDRGSDLAQVSVWSMLHREEDYEKTICQAGKKANEKMPRVTLQVDSGSDHHRQLWISPTKGDGSAVKIVERDLPLN